MKKQNKKQLSMMIAIPTRYGGPSLLEAAKTLVASVDADIHEFVVVADSHPIEKKLLKSLNKLGVKVIWNDTPGSQFKKLKQLVDMSKSDIFVFTQDDIIFHPEALREIRNAFQNDPELTMVGSRILPLPPVSFFESILATMVRLVDGMGRRWNNQDNHLLASGRCLSFRTSLLKKFRILETVVNGDMYLYLENRRLGGKFAFAEASEVYIRCPSKMKDQIGPSSRYQFSQKELQNYFKFDIKDEYRIPVSAIVGSVSEELLRRPLQTLAYGVVYLYTRLRKQPVKTVSNPIWQVDESTKKVA